MLSSFETKAMAGKSLYVITVLSFLYVSCVCSVSVTKCKSDDSKCAKASAQELIPIFANGIPEDNVKTLDPLILNKIDASTSTLKLILTDMTITGLQKCVAKKVKRDKAKNKLFLKFVCPIQLEGQYEMDGKLLLLPIQGKGPLHVKISKMEFNIEGDLGEIEKEGVLYWDMKDWKYSYKLQEKSDVVFENLFEGNEVLAQASREMISNSGNEIILEVGDSTIAAAITSVVNDVKNWFHANPAHNLSID